jgi:branched-subunit amino acid aminotransferase/4-amino-4-deoxychorismate lyase
MAPYNSIPYQWDLHLARLKEAIDTLKIPTDLSGIYHLCTELIKKNEVNEGILRLSISRGIGSNGYLPTTTSEQDSTIVIETLPLPPAITAPVDLWISNLQKVSARALPVHVKLMQGVNSIMARMEAAEHNCFDALMLGDRAQICECSSGNIFWYRDNTLFTPSHMSGIMAGTTREAVIRLFPKVKEGLFLLKELHQAEEVFITNTTYQVIPVKSLSPLKLTWDNFSISRQIQERLQQDIKNYAAAKKQPVDMFNRLHGMIH